MVGMRRSRPKAKTAASWCTGAKRATSKVTRAKDAAAGGQAGVVKREVAVGVGKNAADGGGVGAGFEHGGEIEFEMAGVAAAGGDVALLGEDQLVDEAAVCGVAARGPGHRDAGHLALQRLEQRHEVPDGDDVVFHEDAHGFAVVEELGEAVAGDGGAERGGGGVDLGDRPLDHQLAPASPSLGVGHAWDASTPVPRQMRRGLLALSEGRQAVARRVAHQVVHRLTGRPVDAQLAGDVLHLAGDRPHPGVGDERLHGAEVIELAPCHRRQLSADAI
jgi:hypothetical protein